MGVSGSGKSTIGMMLARDLGCDFRDADDLHPQENRDKMHRGIPLTDEDRRPWLAAVRALIDRYESAGTNLVIACSALKEAYRKTLTDGVHDDANRLSERFDGVDRAAFGGAPRTLLRCRFTAQPVRRIGGASRGDRR